MSKPPRYNSAISVAFTVDHDCVDPLDLPLSVLVAALLKRVENLLLETDGSVKEAFDAYDTYERDKMLQPWTPKVGERVVLKATGAIYRIKAYDDNSKQYSMEGWPGSCVNLGDIAPWFENEPDPKTQPPNNNPTAHPSGKEPPAGYRWLACGERLADGDLSISRKGVQPIAEDMAGNFVAVKWLFIRKIEAPTKRYREPTLEDLANGPIECEVRDCDIQAWRKATLQQIIPGAAYEYRVRKHNSLVEDRYAQCRIEVTK